MRTSNVEPSGVRLLRLINTQLLDIFRKESGNSDRLCLYGTGGYWTAFDRSAYSLSLIFPDLDSFVVNPPGCPFSVVGLTVAEKDLKNFMRRHAALRQGLDYLEFAVGSIKEKDYEAWHNNIVSGYKDIINGAVS